MPVLAGCLPFIGGGGEEDITPRFERTIGVNLVDAGQIMRGTAVFAGDGAQCVARYNPVIPSLGIIITPLESQGRGCAKTRPSRKGEKKDKDKGHRPMSPDPHKHRMNTFRTFRHNVNNNSGKPEPLAVRCGQKRQE